MNKSNTVSKSNKPSNALSRIVMVRIFKARTRDWWFNNYEWTGVNYEDMPDRLITKKEFWRKYSPTNGC